MSRVRGRAPVETMAMKLCPFVEAANIMNSAKFGIDRLRGMVCAKGQIYAFPIGGCNGPYNIALP